MKIYKYILPALFSLALTLGACSNASKNEHKDEHEGHDEHEENVVSISQQQNNVLKLKFETLQKRNMNDFVVTNGILEVQPKNKASISFPIGANVSKIHVSQGERVHKGSILASLTHPDIIDIQTAYQQALISLEFLEKDYQRQKLLLKNNVASGKQYQKIKSDYYSKKSEVEGLAYKLSLLNISSKVVAEGKIIREVVLRSSINGLVSKVNINLGKFVEPQQELFELIDIRDMHVDLKVFEGDMDKIAIGQKVVFRSNKDTESYAKVVSIASSIDNNTRAITIHAIIKNNTQKLVPGMYVSGRILTGEQKVYAVPEAAVVNEGDKSYVFVIDNDEHDDEHKDEHQHHDGEHKNEDAEHNHNNHHNEEGHNHDTDHAHSDAVNNHDEHNHESEHGNNNTDHKDDEHDHSDHGHINNKADQHKENKEVIKLKMLEVKTGITDMGYVQIEFFEKQNKDIRIAQNGSYYLLAEMNKGETEHVH